jgi:class 3 adenylate cyclase
VRFRAKVFLAVLLPASFLVAASLAAALVEITREGERAGARGVKTTKSLVSGILERKNREFKRLEETFGGAWYQEFMTDAVDPAKRPELQERLVVGELTDFRLPYDYLGVSDRAGTTWFARYGHDCEPGHSHRADVGWIRGETRQAVFAVDGAPHLGRRILFPASGGSITLGLGLSDDLKGLPVEVALLFRGLPVYVSRTDWTPVSGEEGDRILGGERFLSGSSVLEGGIGELVLARSMADSDQRRRTAVLGGAAGLALAVIVAALVSLRVAHGVSRPVETLVAATGKVGAGDYTVTVDIPGRDEMADLGRAFNGMTEGLRKRREIMEKTLSRDVAEELMKGVELGGERRDVSILFMDVRGFTSATEGVDPAVVVATLNDMMGELAGAISRNGGNVNKFLGDGLMAMFGAPRDLPDHALHAVRAALEMQKAMAAWNVRKTGGLSGLRIGIGVNAGVAVGGKVGSKERLEYTLIGEEVNLASRVCGKAAPGQVLATKPVFDRLGGRVPGRELEPITVKGLSYPVQVYEVTG